MKMCKICKIKLRQKMLQFEEPETLFCKPYLGECPNKKTCFQDFYEFLSLAYNQPEHSKLEITCKR